MATPVEVPKVGNTVEECIVGRWLKHKGDTVAAGDVIAEIETDKTTVEIASPASGTLLEVYFEEGALASVFARLCLIGEPGEAAAAAQPVNGDGAHSAAGVAPALEAASGRDAKMPAWPAESPLRAAAAASSYAPAPVPVLSPRARRFAREHNFHPDSVAGSGPGGRVLEADLEKLFAVSAAAAAPAPAKAAVSAVPAAGERMSTMRERIARRMRESISNTAQYTLHSWADASGLLALRAKVKASPSAMQVTINDMVLFAVTRALLEMPALNAELIDGRLVRHASIHLGFACDTDRGLMVPVVRDAQNLSLIGLARRTAELAQQAVAGTISPDDLAGATFTVSNLGNLGVEFFTPILNPPQVAILGVDAIQPRLARKDNKIEIVDSIGLSLTCDHQAIDGAPGARFLKVLRDQIERVESASQIGSSI